MEEVSAEGREREMSGEVSETGKKVQKASKGAGRARDSTEISHIPFYYFDSTISLHSLFRYRSVPMLRAYLS